jgi:predicted HTH domain antitoxin
MQLTINLPSSVSEEEARVCLAIKLFELKKVSLGLATEIAEVPKEKFMKILGEYKIPIFNYPAEDLDREMEIWKKV